MRSEVPPGGLPGETQRSSMIRDVSSYRAISQAAELVYDQCIKTYRILGWAQVGRLTL